MVMNNSLPGIPTIYYGEEYGQIGAGGVDSMRDMKFQSKLTFLESHLKERISRLNFLRTNYTSLSLGDFIVLRESKNYTVWLKSYYNEKVIVLFNLQEKTIDLNVSLPFETYSLTSLLNDEVIQLENPNMVKLVIPPYETEIFLLNTK